VKIRFAFFNAYHHRIAYFLHNGGFEYAALAVWKERAVTAATIYDVGGFNGMYGLLAAKVNPKARVLIFEPDPVNARHIRQNIELNDLTNCDVAEIALSDHQGTELFLSDGTTGARFGDGFGTNVRVDTLNAYPLIS
jgi:hypothetical protein